MIVRKKISAFSLVEVVLALGIVGIGVLVIIGLVPVGLRAGRASQDQTRSTQIAQDILNSIASQAATSFNKVVIQQPWTKFSYNLDLTNSYTYTTISADNDGSLVVPSGNVMNYPYQLKIIVAPDPPGFPAGSASQVTVRITTPPSANPSATPSSNQTVRDFARIFTKY